MSVSLQQSVSRTAFTVPFRLESSQPLYLSKHWHLTCLNITGKAEMAFHHMTKPYLQVVALPYFCNKVGYNERAS